MTACDTNPGLLRCVPASAASTLGLLLVLVCSATVEADIIYKTVAENGVVTYSDTPPADDMPAQTLVIDVRAPEISESAQEQLEALRETTDRMVADRQQREKHRAELRLSRAQSEPPAQVIEYTTPARYGGTYPVYYPYPVYCPAGNCRQRPAHPIARPPLYPQPPTPAPGSGFISPGYDYPASLIRRGYSPEVRAAFEK